MLSYPQMRKCLPGGQSTLGIDYQEAIYEIFGLVAKARLGPLGVSINTRTWRESCQGQQSFDVGVYNMIRLFQGQLTDLLEDILVRWCIEGHSLGEEEVRHHPHRPKVTLLSITSLDNLRSDGKRRTGECRHGWVVRAMSCCKTKVDNLNWRIDVVRGKHDVFSLCE